jgi:hypothetical protein
MKASLKLIGICVFLLLLALILLRNSRQSAFVPLSPDASSTPSPSMLPANPKDPNDMVILDAPLAGTRINSPLRISGRARGSWFFEASFPVILTDWDGKIIAEGPIMTASDWMTRDYVPFSGTLTFEKPSYGERGTLILRRDNPSGLPEHDAAYEIPILFD